MQRSNGAGDPERQRALLRGCLVLCAMCLALLLWVAPPLHAQVSPATEGATPTDTSAAAPAASQAAAVPSAQAAAPQTSASQTASSIVDARPALSTSVWSQAGLQVSAIQFDGVTFAPDDPLLASLTQKAMTPLDPNKVRDDLRRLFSSGRYRDISVRGERSGDSMTLIYAGVPRYYVGRVEIAGLKSERLAALQEFATKLDPGTAYTEALVPAAIDGIKASLQTNGYYQPDIKVTTSKDDAGHQVNFVFSIAVGPQARVGNIVLEGTDTGYTVAELRKQAGLNCGKLALFFSKSCRPKITRDTSSNALASLRAAYQKKDRLEATVSVQKTTYNAARKQLDYDFMASQGPIVKVEVDGTKISKSRLHLLVPVYEEGAVDNDLLNEGSHNIRDFLQQQGYFNVTADVQLLNPNTNAVTVKYVVEPGQKHKVHDVLIKGNKYFDTDTILERLSVKKADAYQRSGTYSQNLVSADVNSILALYRANGFANAKVSTGVKDTDNGPNGRALKEALITVTFTITEGAQKKFGSVQLTGVGAEREKEIHGLLQTEEDQPFSLLTLSGDRDSVLGYYLAHGFDQARVEIQQDLEDEDKNAADVVFNVAEGEQVFTDHVLLSGIVHTKPKIVQSQLLVHAGDPLDQAALLETQRNLYNLALFNEVNAAVQNPTGDAPRKNVLVQLTEARRWDVTYGFGFEAQTGTPATVPGQYQQGSTAAQNGKAGISPRVSLDISRIGLFGTQKSLTLHTDYGLLERVATVTFNNPQLLAKQSLTGSVSGGYSNVQNISTFQSSTLQGDVRVTQKYKRADTFIYDFQYRRVSVAADSLEISPNLIPQLSEPVTVGGPAITWYHDTRDPSPLDAGRGQYLSVQEFFANSKFGSDTNFNRLDTTYATYYTFGKKKYVLARNTRIGFENTFGSTTASQGAIGANSNCNNANLDSDDGATCNPIPLPERLYAGGATSHRGFGINDAGPRDLITGYPVGGSGVVINTVEMRFPPPTLPLVGNSISFVLFHDMGNVFQHPGDMFKSIKNFSQPNQATCSMVLPKNTPVDILESTTGTCNFNYYSHAIGAGARYKTPVGPIRVDFSYNLNPTKYPVNFDYTSNSPYAGQAPHFNFFFSIGQAF